MSTAGKHAHPATVGNDWLMNVEVYSFYASYKGNARSMGVANTIECLYRFKFDHRLHHFEFHAVSE